MSGGGVTCADQAEVEALVTDILAEHPPATTPDRAPRGARFDAGPVMRAIRGERALGRPGASRVDRDLAGPDVPR